MAALAGLWAAFVAGVCFHVIGTGQHSTAGRRGRVALGLSVWLWWNGSAFGGRWWCSGGRAVRYTAQRDSMTAGHRVNGGLLSMSRSCLWACLSMSAFHTIGHRPPGMGRGSYGIIHPRHFSSIRKSLHLPHTTSKITHPSNPLKNRSDSSITTEYRFMNIQLVQ